MDNVFLIDDELENTNQDYINENNIIYRQSDLVDCEDNKSGIYDIHKLIYKEISRENLLLSSKDLKSEHNDIAHDSKTLKFDLSLNKSGGVSWKKNVIGFRLNECIYTSPVYNITDNNNKINVNVNITSTDHYITIPNGYYTIQALVDYINDSTTAFNDDEKMIISTYFSASYSCTECKVTITSISDITFSAIDSNSLLYNLGFRFDGTKHLTAGLPYPAETHPSLNTGAYIDIVVDEIPYGACKQNPRGLNIIHRLPITTSTNTQTIGPIVHYKSGYFNNDNQHLFPPMNLSHLTIHLYMDGQELPLENLTISFEFELVILNK